MKTVIIIPWSAFAWIALIILLFGYRLHKSERKKAVARARYIAADIRISRSHGHDAAFDLLDELGTLVKKWAITPLEIREKDFQGIGKIATKAYFDHVMYQSSEFRDIKNSVALNPHLSNEFQAELSEKFRRHELMKSIFI